MRAIRSACLALAIAAASGSTAGARQPPASGPEAPRDQSREERQKMLLIAKDPPQDKGPTLQTDLQQTQLEARMKALESRTRRNSRTTRLLFIFVCVLAFVVYKNTRGR